MKNAILIFQNVKMGNHIHPFVKSETDAFCKCCEKVILVCLEPDANQLQELSNYTNLKILTISIKDVRRNIKVITFLFNQYGRTDISCAIKAKCFDFGYFKETFKVLMYGETLAQAAIREIKGYGDLKDWVVEGFWLSASAYATARIKERYPEVYAFSRAHSSEIDPIRNKYSVCMQKKYISSLLDGIFFVSEWALSNYENLIMSLYGKIDYTKDYLVRLGTLKMENKFNTGSQDEIIRILTCSRVVKLKRLELLAQALKSNKFSKKILWTHIGDGPLIGKLKDCLIGMPDNVKVEFLGNKTNQEVHHFLVNEPVDIFINVSKYEGLPVSIMEAQSYGIPVIATDVGGTRELVNEKNGRLLPAEVTSQHLQEALLSLIVSFENAELRNDLRSNAFKTWKENSDKERNYFYLFELINLKQ